MKINEPISRQSSNSKRIEIGPDHNNESIEFNQLLHVFGQWLTRIIDLSPFALEQKVKSYNSIFIIQIIQ